MLTAEAHVETERPGRYLVQLCKHFSNKGRHLSHLPAGIRPDRIHVEWTDTHGTARLPWGLCTLRATPGTLTLRIEAPDEENLQRLQDLVTTHLGRFSRRDPLTVNWQRSGATDAQPAEPVTRRRRHGGRTGLAVAAAVLVMVAVHLELGGAVLADTPWTGWAVGFVVTAVLVKVGIVASLALRRAHRR
ncbi:DUF2218 domain-containing protein [Streptomyces dysideae]|uniref:DUF2218 domain-containing protein n=1 Tax=Streptomyces dysideae TaxID=909626 RepID=UPI0008303E17|nr:DUF2218 domain-containing protein [Streptomyces dysideae]